MTMRRNHVVKRGYWSVELFRNDHNGHPYESKNFRSFKNAYSYFRIMSRYHYHINLLWHGMFATTREYEVLLVIFYDRAWYNISGEKYIFNTYGCLKDCLWEI